MNLTDDQLSAELHRIASPMTARPDIHSLVLARVARRRRNRMGAITAGGLVTAALLVGAISLTTRPDGQRIRAVDPTTDPTLGAAEDAAPAPPEPAPGTEAPTTVGPVTTVPIPITAFRPVVVPGPPPAVELSPDVSAELAAVQASVIQSLGQLTSFSATATIRRSFVPADPPPPGTPVGDPDPSFPPPDAPAGHDDITRNVVALRGDGSLWVETEFGGFASYDATTGVSLRRDARTEQDAAAGRFENQEVVGWADNSVPLLIMFGHDPVLDFNQFDATASLSVVEHDGRPAWQIEYGRLYEDYDDEFTLVVDQATGLLVRSKSVQTTSDGVSTEESSFTDLATDIAWPAAFPGSLPPGEPVDRSGDPNGFRPISLADASAAFGDGVLLPAVLPPTARVSLATVSTSFGTDDLATTVPADATFESLVMTVDIPDGFLRSQIELSRTLAKPGQPAPAGMIVVDGALCRSSDLIRCNSTAPDGSVATGPLAAAAVTDGASVTADIGTVSYRILAINHDDAVALAASLVPYPPVG